MADEFYYVENGTQQGPVDGARLIALLTSKLTPDTLVWREGMAAWTPARQVPELAASFPSPPPPSPPQTTGDTPSLNPFTVLGRTFSWTGKFNRGEYLVALITAWVIGMLLAVVIAFSVAFARQSVVVAVVAGLIGIVWVVGITLAGLGAMIRRVHDLGVSPWAMLLMLVPLANFIWFLYLLFAPGKPDTPPVQKVPGVVLAILLGIAGLVLLGVLATVAIPALLAARQPLDMSSISTAVSEGLQSQLALPIASVGCPTEAHPRRAGDAFTCVAVPAAGGRLTVTVTQQDDQGHVTWKLTKLEGLIDLRAAERAVVNGLRQQAHVDTTVTCGGRFRASQAGEVFDCQVKANDGRTAVAVVTITDSQGNISWKVKE